MEDPEGPSPATEAMLTIRPAALPPHCRCHRLDAEHGTGEVDREDLLPFFVGHRVEVVERNPLVVRRIVDQKIQTPKRIQHASD